MMKLINYPSLLLLLSLSGCINKSESIIMTVKGPVPVSKMGITLTHEHILVDFIGADFISDQRWERAKVIEKVLPFLIQIRKSDCNTFIDCTPEFIGRDPVLLKTLSNSSGLNIITNTGYYGAGNNNKYLPGYAFSETAEVLSERWIAEWENGIKDTGIKPGFIKIGITGDSLSALHKKLVVAAALTHLKTGLAIASHTGPSPAAFEQIEILKEAGVAPEAFIWVHAQAEKDPANRIKAAGMGVWISLDGLNENNVGDYVIMIKSLKNSGMLSKVLLSHDAGWFDPGKPDGGEFRGFNTLFEKLVPALSEEKFSKAEINQILVSNPAMAFAIKIHKISREAHP
jgi:phosphotriesterase-related protein